MTLHSTCWDDSSVVIRSKNAVKKVNGCEPAVPRNAVETPIPILCAVNRRPYDRGQIY
jgi:hypothetical protein